MTSQRSVFALQIRGVSDVEPHGWESRKVGEVLTRGLQPAVVEERVCDL